MTQQDAIRRVCQELQELLLEKNASYGGSIFAPLRIFSRASIPDLINARIDDKLSRIARGTDDTEDTELDLIGYLILRRIWRQYASHLTMEGSQHGASVHD